MTAPCAMRGCASLAVASVRVWRPALERVELCGRHVREVQAMPALRAEIVRCWGALPALAVVPGPTADPPVIPTPIERQSPPIPQEPATPASKPPTTADRVVDRLARSGAAWTVAELREALPDINPNTIASALTRLSQSGRIEVHMRGDEPRLYRALEADRAGVQDVPDGRGKHRGRSAPVAPEATPPLEVPEVEDPEATSTAEDVTHGGEATTPEQAGAQGLWRVEPGLAADLLGQVGA